MNPQFSQAGGSVSKDVNKQSIARIYGVKMSEVAYLKAGLLVDSYKVLYDKTTQTCWYRGTATGTVISWTISNPVSMSLVCSSGSFTLPKALSWNNGKEIRFKDLGVKGDGTDETAAIASAISIANSLKVNLKAEYGSLFKLSGNTNITINYGIDWNGSTINIDQYTGKFLINRPTELQPINLAYDSPEVKAIRDKGEILWGGVINAWANNTALQNYYIVINTNIDAFIYRNTTFKMVARNRLYRGGALAHNFDYPIPPSAITSIDLYPVPDRVTEFKGVVFSKQLDPRDLMVVEHSKIKISDVVFNHYGATVTTGMIWLNSNNCFDMEWSGITSPYGQKYLSNSADPGSIQATYTFRIGDSYNCYLHDITSNGLEWGTIGTDEVTNCLVEKCVLARYDSHRPFHGWLVIKDSTIGAKGISAQAAGDKLLCSNVKFVNNSINDYTPNNGLPYIINSRGDALGIFDADLIIESCTIVNNLDMTIHLVAQNWGPQYSPGLPVGSPYRQVSFRTVTITDPIVKTIPGSNNSCVDFGIREALTGTTATPTGANSPDMPFNITLRGIKSRDGGLCSFTLTNTRPASDSRKTSVVAGTTNPFEMITNIEINIQDCVFTDRTIPLTLTDVTDTYSVRMKWDGFRAMSDLQTVSMRIYMPILLNAVNSRVREIRPFYNSVTLVKPMGFSFSACDLYPPDAFISWDPTATNRFCSLSACNILADSMATLAKMAAYKLSGCRYYQTGVGQVQVPITTSLSGDSATFLNVSWMSTDNTYRIELDQGSWPITIPQPTKAIYMDLGFSEDGQTPKRMKVYRSSGSGGALGLTKFNNPLPTYIYLP